MKAFSTAIIIIFLFILPAEGSSWLEAAKSDNGDTFFVDISSIEGTQIYTIKVWTKLIYREPKYLKDNANLAYVVTHEEHDCEEGKSRDLKITFFNKDAEVIHTSSEIEDWSYPPPETVMIEVHRFICKLIKRFPSLISSNN